MSRLATVMSLLIACLLLSSSISAGEYIEAGEVAAISVASGGSLLLGHHLWGWDSTRTPLIRGPLPLEVSVQRLLSGHRSSWTGKMNFLDDRLGSAITPLVAGVALFVTNLSYPQADKWKGTGQDMFLFLSGVVATSGITSIAKGVVSRPRPYMTILPSEQRPSYGFRVDRSSFFSGHTSAAFFSATYLNLRLRTVMRSEMSCGEYRNWRWAPPTFLFSWASFVGLSRIHAYKHYLSDVLVGALAGYLVAELFYSFGKAGSDADSDSALMIFRVSIPL